MKYIANLKQQIEEGCRFCFPPERERILYETENFYVMVSLGPIVEGYLLIVSKEHIGACLHLPSSHIPEFITLKDFVKGKLCEEYGSCLFYEHGKVGTSLIGKDHHHCFHAHMHCIPVPIQLNDVIEKEIPEGIEADSLDKMMRRANDCERYLYVEDQRCVVYTPTTHIRSQYLRYKLAHVAGLPERWDWVNNQNWPLIEKTVSRLKPRFNG